MFNVTLTFYSTTNNTFATRGQLTFVRVITIILLQLKSMMTSKLTSPKIKRYLKKYI